jgi:hypothetical protein
MMLSLSKLQIRMSGTAALGRLVFNDAETGEVVEVNTTIHATRVLCGAAVPRSGRSGAFIPSCGH